MYPRHKYNQESTSTPKRRRLGTGRILRTSQSINKTPKNKPSVQQKFSSPTRCISPCLPCNQVEFLNDSGKNFSIISEIPCSPEILGSSLVRDLQNWESLAVNNSLIDEICDGNKDDFNKKFEEIDNAKTVCCTNDTNKNLVAELFTSKCERYFRENIEESFNAVNQSICGLADKDNTKAHLFETKDSFLLDIRESSLINEQENENLYLNYESNSCKTANERFYGLPIKCKDLFRSLRKIEKFYDWQEECLKLEAIKERRNLIYALPTSGGKTLVAEVLMLREVLNRRRNALFILPFVAIVQEKIWSLSPFAVQLDFLVEEYAAGRGNIPPKKRRKKNSIYIGTIEKALALIRSLIETNRLEEVGLIVVDELHLIGEAGRGATLETLLSTVIFANKGIQIVGMSATIGNLQDIARFLKAEVYQRDFRPVELTEYVKLGNMLHKIVWDKNGMEIIPDREVTYEYSGGPADAALDPERVCALVGGTGGTLVFCATQRAAQSLAALLAKLMHRELVSDREPERAVLAASLSAEGSNELSALARRGVVYHHAGLSADERVLIEQAFRSGVVRVVCCTSTLAAGVNLPARRVVVRSPRVGRAPLSLAAYRQMAGRAGRAGVCDTGESIILCSPSEWPQLKATLNSGLAAVRSSLHSHLNSFILSAVALRLAYTRTDLRKLIACTLMYVELENEGAEDKIKQLCDDSLRSLLQSGAIDVAPSDPKSNASKLQHCDCYVYNDTQLNVSSLGKAAIKGCMELSTAKQLMRDLEAASRSLVLMGSLHLLYLVTPHDGAGIKPDYRLYHELYNNLDEEGLQTARVVGITERTAVRMVTGRPIAQPPASVLRRFYVALMLRDLWRQLSVAAVADKYSVPRGAVQNIMSSASSFCCCAQRFSEQFPALWHFASLLQQLAPRLQHCAAPELQQLLELPAVRKARAMQLMRSGFKRIEDIAKSNPEDLTSAVTHLSRTAATHLISAARMMLIEKVENLRAEAEDVMEDLKIT